MCKLFHVKQFEQKSNTNLNVEIVDYSTNCSTWNISFDAPVDGSSRSRICRILLRAHGERNRQTIPTDCFTWNNFARNGATPTEMPVVLSNLCGSTD